MALFACYIFVMIDTAINYPSRKNKEIIEIFNTIMFCAELFQICIVRKEYFIHVENYIDLAGMLFMYLYSH